MVESSLMMSHVQSTMI